MNNDISATGWIVAVVTGVWGLVMRILLGRYNDHVATMRRIDERLGEIERDIAGIKGVLRERDRNGRHSWPYLANEAPDR